MTLDTIVHIDHAFPEETRPMMYKMMKWWGGKPHNIFAEYIRHYSKKDEIVLDPFCGRGVSIIEAVINDRKAIGIDLNPMAIFMTKMIVGKLDLVGFVTEWKKLRRDFQKFEIDSGLYQTKCTKCSNKARVFNVQYKDQPFQVVYKCGCTRKGTRLPYILKKIDSDDLQLIEKSKNKKIEYWYPKDKFPPNEAFDIARKEYGDSYADFFTKRNLYLLSYMYDRINKIADNDLKQFFKFAFVSMLHLATGFPAARKAAANRFGAGSWGRPAFLKLDQRMEQNPFVLYERAIMDKQGVIKGKISSHRRIGNKVKWAQSFEDLSIGKNFLLMQKNTLELTKLIPKESVDYVITDPPYGGLIDYFDLSSLWTVWLKGEKQDKNFEMPFSEEITIDDNRSMGDEYYNRMLRLAFSQVFDVLKEGKYMTVTFHNDEPKIFNMLNRACEDAGFVAEKVLYQANKRAGETGVSNPWGTSISDFYIRFRKPKKGELHRFIKPEKQKFELVVVRAAKQVLASRSEPTEIGAMIPDLYKLMVESGFSLEFESDDQIEQILKRNNDTFENIKETKLWWFSKPFLIAHKMNNIPLSERVEIAVLATLRANYKVSYDDILRTMYEKFPDSLTPDSADVKRIIEEFAEETPDGKWKLKAGESQEEEIKSHTQMEINLAKIGKRLGYSIWCADRTSHPDLEKDCIDKLPFAVPNEDRIKKIDVLWINQDKISYAFEVENSTSITSALERCSNLPTNETKRVIVLPKVRKSFFERKMNQPFFKDAYEKDNWKKVWYESLDNFQGKNIDDIFG